MIHMIKVLQKIEVEHQLLAMSLCFLHTHMLKFSILETSMYTTLTGSNPPTLMLGELRRFISLFLTN